MTNEQLNAASPDNIAAENSKDKITEKTLTSLARSSEGWKQELLSTAAEIVKQEADN
jgi:hypothetical protein